MSFERENARTDGGTSERAGQMSLWATSNPRDNFTTARPVGQGVIEAYLGRGQEAAIPLRQLVAWTGLDELVAETVQIGTAKTPVSRKKRNKSAKKLENGPGLKT